MTLASRNKKRIHINCSYKFLLPSKAEGLNPFLQDAQQKHKMSATKVSGMFRKFTVRFQDAPHGYNKDIIRMQGVSQGNENVSGCVRMFRKVGITFQDASPG